LTPGDRHGNGYDDSAPRVNVAVHQRRRRTMLSGRTHGRSRNSSLPLKTHLRVRFKRRKNERHDHKLACNETRFCVGLNYRQNEIALDCDIRLLAANNHKFF
jgi:hypothetical protein